MISLNDILKKSTTDLAAIMARLAAVRELAKTQNFEVYLVGGAARVLAAQMPRFIPPTDFDIMTYGASAEHTKEVQAILSGNEDMRIFGINESSCKGQKFEIGGVKFDVWEQDLTRWMYGVPCNGDALAIDLLDGDVIVNTTLWPSSPCRTPTGINRQWAENAGDAGLKYIEGHVKSLERDAENGLFVAINENLKTAEFGNSFNIGAQI